VDFARENAASHRPAQRGLYQVAISGDNFIDLLFQFLYDTDIIPMVPS
jgi:hypothetical protein